MTAESTQQEIDRQIDGAIARKSEQISKLKTICWEGSKTKAISKYIYLLFFLFVKIVKIRFQFIFTDTKVKNVSW